MFRQISLLAMISTVASGELHYTGEGMAHTHERFSAGKCNFMYDPGVGNYYAALNSDQWDSPLNCGRCIEVSSENSTSSVTVFVVDECTECEDEGLGLSPLIYKQLTHSDTPQSLTWTFVDCPVSGNIEYCTNRLSNTSWLAVQPANSVTGVAEMKIDNQSAVIVDSGYYFLLDKGFNVNLSAVNIELTSLSGETISEVLPLNPGNCTAGTSNFGEHEANADFDTLKSGGDDYKAGKVTPPDDSTPISTRSDATSSGSSLLFVIPVLLVFVGGLVATYWFRRRRTLAQSTSDNKAVAGTFGTLGSPVHTKQTIAKI
ncbi:Expansin-like protein 1 [Phytophthora citrophthora]|uniref:Expansin-like protein 1 n=1 Tax=Phytophthora citrophthora TaxID=4793 RepID=A0AAD9GLW9_9STRA|nr:Expansin-like protein 1 [Phytophthora citrophthora]